MEVIRTKTTLEVRVKGFVGEYDNPSTVYMTSIDDCPDAFEYMSSKTDQELFDYIEKYVLLGNVIMKDEK